MFSVTAQRNLSWFCAIVSYCFAMYLYFFAGDDFTAGQRFSWELISCGLTAGCGFFLPGGIKALRELDFESWQILAAQAALGMIFFALNFFWWQTDFAPVGRYQPRPASPPPRGLRQPALPMNPYAELVAQLEAELRLDAAQLNWFQADVICALPELRLSPRFLEHAARIGGQPAPLAEALKRVAERDFERAGQLFERAVHDAPEQAPRIRELHGLALLRSGRFPPAARALERIEIQRVYELQTLYHLAAAGIYTAQLPRAGAALERLKEIESTAGAERTTQALARMNLRALWLIESNRCREAQAELEQALNLAYQLSGSTHPDALAVINNLALLKTGLGDYAGAEGLARQLLWGVESGRVDALPFAAQAQRVLAGVWMMLGNLSEAESAARDALKLDHGGGLELNPDAAKDRLLLAKIIQIQNRLEEVELNLRFALNADRELYGLEHPQVARDCINLAGALVRLDRHAEARLVAGQALEFARLTLGAEHPQYALILGAAAGLDQQAGRFEPAEERFRQALAIIEQALGGEHYKTAIVLNNYAALLKEIGRPEEAEELCRRSLHAFRDVFGEAHPWFQVAQKNLIEIKQDLEQLQETEATAETAEGN